MNPPLVQMLGIIVAPKLDNRKIPRCSIYDCAHFSRGHCTFEEKRKLQVTATSVCEPHVMAMHSERELFVARIRDLSSDEQDATEG